jgi:peptidoglycan-N-acetylglucosamine deacetylase
MDFPAKISKAIRSSVGRAVGTITHVDTSEKVVALTFDDGPHSEFTPRLLKILAKHRAFATFFVVGQSAKIHSKMVQDTAEAGHAIGLHGWDHTSFIKLSGLERRDQIRLCEQVTHPYANRIFRPPYGHQSIASHLDLIRLGYKIIGWSLNASDWLFRNSASITEELMSGIKPGSIILLHDAIHLQEGDVNPDRQATLDAVDSLLDRLGSDMKFVTVPELFKYGSPGRENWYRFDEQK